MSLRISVLASGSTGNATYIETENTKILLDAGISGKKMEKSLNDLQRNIAEIKNIFISHEHIDHIRSAGILHRKFGTNIIGNEKTLNSKYFITTTKRDNQDNLMHLNPGQTMKIGDIEITAFKTSHDTICSQFYTFKHQDKKIACLTDTGTITPEMIQEIKGSEIILIESNHDVEMLKKGSRPEGNKQRILSNHGHLSNEQCAKYLGDIVKSQTHTIILGHLSYEHNTEELAYQTIAQHLKNHNPKEWEHLQLLIAKPDSPLGLVEA